MDVVKINETGCRRVLDAVPGMTFVVDRYTPRDALGNVAHVRDYRFPSTEGGHGYQIWSIGPEGYELVKD